MVEEGFVVLGSGLILDVRARIKASLVPRPVLNKRSWTKLAMRFASLSVSCKAINFW